MRVQKVGAALSLLVLNACGANQGFQDPLISAEVYQEGQKEQTAKAGGTDARLAASRADEKQSVIFGSGQFISEPRAGKTSENTNGDVELNFSDANVREVAQTILGSMLGQNIVIDAGIDQRITLRTNKPLNKASLIPTLETTLAASGLALVKDGALYRIVSASKARSSSRSLVIAKNGTLPAGYGITVVQLDHIAPSQMAKILEPFASEKSILRTDDSRNLLIVAGTGPEITSLLEAVATFDVSPLKGMSFGYFKLRHARSAQVAPEIKNLIRAYADRTGLNAPEVISVDRLNSLIVFASQADALKLARQWINGLDQEKEDPEAGVYVYRVKNRKAKDLAPILAQLFRAGGAESISIAATTPPDTPTVDISSQSRGFSSSNRGLVRSSLAPDGNDAGSGSAQAAATDTNATLSSGGRIIADPINNALLIRATPSEYRSIISALAHLDSVPPLVMVDVTIAEVTLNDELAYGIEWFLKKGNHDASMSRLASGAISSSFPGFSYFFAASDIQVVLNAVSSATQLKILSSPKVMVMEHKTAVLQIGDQIPVITSTSQSVSSADAPVIQTVQYYDTGVILKVTPQVNSSGLVMMDISQEVSNVSEETSKTENSSPTIQQRKISSAIAIQSGQAVVLGGLIRDTKTSSASGIPLLSDIPKVGEVFSRNQKKIQRTELVVIINPRVVWDRSDAREATDEIRTKMQAIFGR
ncbi:type II secretion system secretin GspD [Rhodomicrobium lacus]|uniref:type II secretion system secretin GspD n=1 Tax=Rhodomicrobium lacus TaxID=2498452 RepID=UPI0013DF7B0C|nr:type II secretion system secretin GspD [Rhodomicrobium lacus]